MDDVFGISTIAELSPANRDSFFKYGFFKYPIRKKLRHSLGIGPSRLGLNSVSDSVPVKCAVDKRRGKQFIRERDQLAKKPKAHEEGRQQRLRVARSHHCTKHQVRRCRPLAVGSLRCEETSPRSHLPCAYDDPGWNWTHEMHPQRLKRAICELQNGADDAALGNMTECMAKSFGVSEESTIQMAGPTSLCSSNVALVLKIPCGHPLHKDANLLFQTTECINLPVDIQGKDVREFRDVCWECHRAHETENDNGPVARVIQTMLPTFEILLTNDDQSPGQTRAKTAGQQVVRDLGHLHEQWRPRASRSSRNAYEAGHRHDHNGTGHWHQQTFGSQRDEPLN